MEQFLNRLDILFYNTIITKNIEKKELLLNRVLNFIRYHRILTDMINYLYMSDKDTFEQFIDKINKPSLILLTYNLENISKKIKLPDNYYIIFSNSSFHIINNTPISPTMSNKSIHSEWGI